MDVTLVGLGNIGSNLLKTLNGADFRLVAAADSKSAVTSAGGLDPLNVVAKKQATGAVGKIGTDAIRLIEEVQSDVVIELTSASPSDGEPSYSHIRAALKAGRNVVTANKVPLALHYSELLAEARRNGVKLLYGACVGGGLPVFETARLVEESGRVEAVDGVLNATSNFILSALEEGATYERAVAEAQRLGYSESDPTLDINGFDCACKIVILANHVLGGDFTLGDVRPVEGIESLNHGSLGSGDVVRLVAHAKRGSAPEVRRTKVDVGSPLAVKGASNSVVFRCDSSCEWVVSGHAAGGESTSKAVLRDLVSLLKEGRN